MRRIETTGGYRKAHLYTRWFRYGAGIVERTEKLTCLLNHRTGRCIEKAEYNIMIRYDSLLTYHLSL